VRTAASNEPNPSHGEVVVVRPSQDSVLAWHELPYIAQIYIVMVLVAGGFIAAQALPLTLPQPVLFGALLTAACATSVWKVTLPIPLTNGSTLSVSYAADLMALLLLGRDAAIVISVAGVLAQCTINVRKPYPAYRTLFSMGAEAVTMAATALIYSTLNGPVGPTDFTGLARPLVGAVATYFVVNTGLVAGAIAATSDRGWWSVWRDDFLWSGASFMVAGTAGAAAAVIVARGEHWTAGLLFAPVYLTYRTYQVFVGRLEDQKRHTAETQRLHEATINALEAARRAEHALAGEKERLAKTVTELTRLEQTRKDMLEREQAARASAEEASRLKDQFLAMVSHELRTPLNAIVGWSEMLRGRRLSAEDCAKAAESIYTNSRRQARMIDELLDVARITTGKLRLERTAVNLEQVVADALEVVQVAADGKGVQIDVEIDQPVGTLFGDPGRLQQVAWNLLSNAVKFTPPGGRVVLHLDRVESAAVMTVTDTGVGIAAEFLPFVFEPFLQADATTRRAFGGLGLGLSIVRHLVEAHGGTVTVDSRGEGRGTTFTVRLPIISRSVSPWSRGANVDSRSELEHPDMSLKGMSVLVVDDDRENCEVVAANLASREAEVLTAGSAAQALDVLQHSHIDVLLADIAMPSEDGYSLMRKVRAMEAAASRVPAAAVTALARDEDRQQAFQAGFQLHLAKPIDGAALVAAVASLGRLGTSMAPS
jgi:signal transduction histidine kinase/ActR/RegA family two-component response regulator